MDTREFTMYTYGKRLIEGRDQGKRIKQEVDICRTKLLDLMEPNSIQEFPDMVIGAIVHERRAINLTRLRDEYPDVAETCTEVTTSIHIEINRKGGPGRKKKTPSPPSMAPSPDETLDASGYVEYLIQKHLPPTEEMLPKA
jgi:hypothetical protein